MVVIGSLITTRLPPPLSIVGFPFVGFVSSRSDCLPRKPVFVCDCKTDCTEVLKGL